MSFQRPKYNLMFEDEYKGLEVLTRGISLGKVARLAAVLSLGEALIQPDYDTERKELIETMGKALISWNLADENNEPVPATTEFLAEEDWTMVVAIIRGWMNRGSNVPAPLAQPSSDGVPSAVVSIPMDIES